MKKNKIILVFILAVVLIATIVPSVKAGNLEILEPPTNETNEANETNKLNNVENNDANNATNNNIENINTNVNENTGTTENKLPQLGVAEDTTLFVFIAICIVSAIYAYIKIRNYKNL